MPPQPSSMTSILVGLAVGNGTGPELAAVFEHAIQVLADPFGLNVSFVRCPRTYHSYSSLLAINDTDAVTEETIIDATEYHKFCEHVIEAGVSAIFLTSIRAQALYIVREKLQAVKIEQFSSSPTSSILIVRDQAQGFSSGTNTVDATGTTVSRTAQFSKDLFFRH